MIILFINLATFINVAKKQNKMQFKFDFFLLSIISGIIFVAILELIKAIKNKLF